MEVQILFQKYQLMVPMMFQYTNIDATMDIGGGFYRLKSDAKCARSDQNPARRMTFGQGGF